MLLGLGFIRFRVYRAHRVWGLGFKVWGLGLIGFRGSIGLLLLR